jgi:uncharacterized membrane protein YphA (DoxX/SURF4 family)
MTKDSKLSLLKWLATILRLIIGWHLLYEGYTKVIDPEWSSAPILAQSRWVLGDLFQWIASHDVATRIVDFLNAWGLFAAGLGLILGALTRWAAWGAALILMLYVVAFPPIPGYTFGVPMEGSYLVINKSIIEMVSLILIGALPLDFMYGFDRIYKTWKDSKIFKNTPSKEKIEFEKTDDFPRKSRREIIKDLVTVPVLGAFAYAIYKKKKFDSWEEIVLSTGRTSADTGSTLMSFEYSSLANLKGKIPKGKIKDVELSRMILGGNLIGGWAHSRDLQYVSKLVKTYHTDDKVMQTFALAEKCGIDTYLGNPQQIRILNKYWAETGGKMRFISDCASRGDFYTGAQNSIDGGAIAAYCQGQTCDAYVERGDFDGLQKGMDLLRANGLPAGLGGHHLSTIKACVEHDIIPDFWVKTLHHHNYWSAMLDKTRHDNVYCEEPEATIEYMNNLEQPWIAFKVLAAGAIMPEDGFKYALEGGADFLCVGMYDFQLVDNTNTFLDSMSNLQNRVRPWRG